MEERNDNASTLIISKASHYLHQVIPLLKEEPAVHEEQNFKKIYLHSFVDVSRHHANLLERNFAKIQRRFVSRFSGKVRTFSTSVSALEMLEENFAGEEKILFRLAIVACKVLGVVVEDAHDMHRILSDELRLHPHTFALRDLVRIVE